MTYNVKVTLDEDNETSIVIEREGGTCIDCGWQNTALDAYDALKYAAQEIYIMLIENGMPRRPDD